MRRTVRSKIFWLIIGGVCAQISCTLINKPPSPVPATPIPTEVKQNINSVAVEIYNIPIALHQNELVHQLWREVDEQSLPQQLRRDLLAQGFRVGVLGSMLSPALGQLLKVSSDARADTAWGEAQEFSVADAAQGPTIARNLRSLVPGMRALIKIFDDNAMLPELSLFWKEDGGMCGQTYRGALGLICISATANKDGSAQIQIVPELEHGVFEQRLRTQSGMVIQESGRPKHTFESLTVSQRLLPGQWLIMGTTTLDSAGVGKAFFSRMASVPEQRLLAIRFVNATTSDLPSPPPSSLPAPREAQAAMPERY